MSLRNRLDPHATLAEAREVVRRPDFRRAIICGVLALASPGVAVWLRTIPTTNVGRHIGIILATVACALFGVIAARSAANEVARVVAPRGGPAVAGVLRLLITVVGYVLVLIAVLTMLLVPIDRLLLSGAITGVIVGIAAQQSLGNAFAGLVLLFSRPVAVGDYITLRSGALGGEYFGEVTAITLMYTVIATSDGRFSMPNSGVLAAATGPRPRGWQPATATEPTPTTGTAPLATTRPRLWRPPRRKLAPSKVPVRRATRRVPVRGSARSTPR